MDQSKKVLITGSNGFVGKALYDELQNQDYELIGSVRNITKFVEEQSNVVIDSIDKKTDWGEALSKCTTVMHLASRVHILNDNTKDPLLEFRRVNTEGTINLAEQAAEHGVKRFIFLSSIGVCGSKSVDIPFSANTDINPQTPYTQSKLEAEEGLINLASKTDMEMVIVRSPAIYGINAPGNFGLIESSINKGIPLPFGSILNRRSLIYIYNLTSFLSICIHHKEVGNKIFVIDDDHDLSTPEIVSVMAGLLHKQAKIIKFPRIGLQLLLKLIGKDRMRESLMDNLQIDSSATRTLTGWEPPFNPRDFFEN